MHAHDACKLRDREHGRLAIPQQLPGKPSKDIHAAQLCGHPHGWRQQERRDPQSRPQEREAHREQAWKQRQVGHEQRVDDDGDRSCQPAVGDHDLGDPIEGTGERDRARHDAEPKGAREAGRGCCQPAAQGEKQRCEGNPRERGMAKTGKAQRKQRARQDR